MMLMKFGTPLAGLRGLGDVWSTCARTAISFDGSSVECIDSNDNVIASQPVSQKVPPSTNVPDQSSWWQSALTALTKGVTQGATGPSGLVPCISPGVPAGCNFTPPAATPWYQTPMGIGGILAALGLAYFVLKK